MESIPLPPRRSRYVCQQCGEVSVKWLGRCPSCEAWNTLVEELDVRESRPRRAAAGVRSVPATEASGWEEERRSLGVWELDRVLGGGIVPGALVLVGGEPGVGKSTLLLQVAALYAERCGTVLYVSGEESVGQVAMRARRLGTVHPRLRLLSEARVEVIEEVIAAEEPELVVVDSIQTMLHPDLETGPGSVAQVRECCHFLGRIGKERGIAVFFIGHVTKQGTLAGPKVLEHAVDVVLHVEGESHSALRLLRPVKNRFGSTQEVGIFEMTAAGLKPVENPSELFLQERPMGSPGSVVTASREGSRPLLVEVQALVAPTAFGGTPRRQAAGVDYNRVSIILAVLERRVGIPLQTHDVYVNVAGGVKTTEPACDLAIALAVASSFHGRPVDPSTVVFGEVGLSGEVRSVGHGEERLQEAARLGFRRAVVPAGARLERAAAVAVAGVRSVEEAISAGLGGSAGKRGGGSA